MFVPGILQADKKMLRQISGEAKDKYSRARERKIQSKEMEGSTFTIYNLVMFGIEIFTSIINQPGSIQRCYDAMNDDFNSPKLISHLFEAGNLIESFVKGKEFLDIYDIQLLHMNLRNFLTEVLGVNIPSDLTVKKNRYHKLIDLLLEIRKLVRKEKKWDISDRIRNELFHLGYSLIDNEDGSTCLNPNL